MRFGASKVVQAMRLWLSPNHSSRFGSFRQGWMRRLGRRNELACNKFADDCAADASVAILEFLSKGRRLLRCPGCKRSTPASITDRVGKNYLIIHGVEQLHFNLHAKR